MNRECRSSVGLLAHVSQVGGPMNRRPTTLLPLLTVLALGCGGARPAGSRDQADAALPEALTCDGALPPGERIAAEPGGTEARRQVTQPMSAVGAEGLRMFKQQRWDASIPLLRNAAGGRGGDDRANRDLSQFRLGVALLFTGQDSEAKALLGVIARDPANAARPEMLVWLADSSVAHPGLAHYFGAFDDADVAAIEGPEAQRSKVNYMIGRQRFEQKTFADAMFFFSQVKPPSTFTRHAQRCVAKIDANTNAARGAAPQAAR